MKFLKDENGQTLVLTVLSMTVVLGFMALAVDVGVLFRARRNVQTAADAAVVAGALDYKYNSTGQPASATAAARAAATQNGVTNGVGGVVVTINAPPQSGPYAGSTGFVEALVTQPNPTFFMKYFGFGSVKVGARAVAGSGLGSGCIWALAKSGTDVSLTGSGSINAVNCQIFDDSNAPNALTMTGSGSITAKAVGIVGGYSKTGTGTISPTPVTGIAPAADPLAGLPAPTIPTGTCPSNCVQSNSGSQNMTLNPGTYTSISNNGSGTLTLTPGTYIITGSLTNNGSGALILGAGHYSIGGDFKSTGSTSLTLGAGSYYIGGNLMLTGSGSLIGQGVTFYTQGATTVTGSGNMNLTAPTSGPYNGVLFFQSRSDASAMSITGSGGDVLRGILYAPAAALTLTGSGSMTVSLDIIVDTLKETGSGSITDQNYAVVSNPNSVLSKLVMVE